MRTIVALLSFTFTFLTVPGSLVGQDASAGDPTPAHWTTHHSIRVGDQTVEYDATVGSIILRDGDEKATAEMYYTAYTRSGVTELSHRPVLFAYNGGPGRTILTTRN